jgi:L-ribulose-5-phosphate 3-epimerase
MISRRDFLGMSAAGAAGLLLASQLKAYAGVTAKLSACDWAFSAKNQPDGLVAAKAVGLDGLEVSAEDEPRDVLKIADPAFRQQYKDKMKETGLVVSSVAMGLLNGCPVASDPRVPAWLEQTIDATADLGAKVILVAFFGRGDLRDKNDDLKPKDVDVTVERIKAAAVRAEKAGVILGLENTLSAAQNLAILDRIQSNAVRVYYDICNSTNYDYVVPKEIRELKDRICQIHFKENVDFLGEGKVDMKGVAAAMNEINYNGWVVLETRIKDKDRDGSFKKNAEYTKKLLGLA